MVLTGTATLVLTIWMWLVRRRLSASVEGVVTALDQRGSGEFPIVTFTPSGAAGGPAGPVEFHSTLSLGAHPIGQRLLVHYEPGKPEHASIASATMSRITHLSMGFMGALIAGSGLLLTFVLGPAEEARDQAVKDFIAAARTGDARKLVASAVPGAKLDQTLLLAEAPLSKSLRFGSSGMDFDDSCVEVVLTPRQTRLLIYVVQRGGTWRVQRAGAVDAECEARIDD